MPGSTISGMGETPQGDNPSNGNGRLREPADKPEEFERFEDLARKLAQVPKDELEEKRKAAQAAKA